MKTGFVGLGITGRALASSRGQGRKDAMRAREMW